MTASISTLYTVSTKIIDDHLIEQEVWLNKFEDERELLERRIASLREEQVRKILIDLGWTPPEEI